MLVKAYLHSCQPADRGGEHEARSGSAHLSLGEHLSPVFITSGADLFTRCVSFTLTHSAAVITSSEFPLDSLYVVGVVF